MRVSPLIAGSMLVVTLTLAAPGSALAMVAQEVLPERVNIHSHTLKNGLRMLMVEDHKAPVVTFQVWYQVGSKDEHQGITGSSHLLEHMMFQGANKYGKGQFDRTLLKYGGQNNAFTTENFTAYYETFASDRLEIGFDLEADRMEGALITADQLKSEKEVVKEELRTRSDNSPVGATWEALVSHMFVAHPYHWPVGGWPSDVTNVSREDVYKHYRTYYRPDNAIVVIVGDFETAQAIDLAERYFGPLEPGLVFPRNATEEPPQIGERRIELVKPVDTPIVMAGFRVPAASHADTYPLLLLDLLLSNGESSRLYQDLIYKGRVAQTVESGLERGKDWGEFYVMGQPLPGKTPAQVEAGLEAELSRLSTNLVDDAELRKAKNIAVARYVFARESAEGLATELGTTASLSSADDYNSYLERITAVSREDLMRVAKTYFGQENRTVVTLRPGAAADQGGKQ
jgi:zinc protease